MGKIKLLHGSDHIIEKPDLLLGKTNNDYGRGFYCTQELSMAMEWACKKNSDGFVNKYVLEQDSLNILNLLDGKYNILHWMALLLKNRTFRLSNEIAIDACDYIIENFSIDLKAYDVIIGYRADDSYFDYAESFLNNGITVEQLARAMRLGKLGEQIVLKSRFAFSKLHYEGFEVADRETYFCLRKARNDEANRIYMEMLEEESDGLYIQDIMRGGIQNDDPRIPRNVSK